MARVFLGLLFVALPAGADAPRPDINAPFREPDVAAWTERFEREGREVFDKRHEIVAATGVKPGMTVADVGAGTGLFTLLFAQAVGPAGRVYAVDISRPFVVNILKRAESAGLTNVWGVVNPENDARLPEKSLDLAFICDTYHHLDQPQEMMMSVRRALKDGGRVVVVDFDRIPGVSSEWVLRHVRAEKEVFIREIEHAGFRLVGQQPVLRTNFFLEFEKR